MAQISRRNLFLGFSTADTAQTGVFKLSDLALVKRDLLNHFHTRIGERVMRPTWGCAIWDYLFEPLTPTTRAIIEAEAQRVCESDSRVAVQSIVVIEFDNGLRIEIDLEYRPYAVFDTFTLDFERRQTDTTSGNLQ